MSPPAEEPEHLLAHASWVRGLAHHLVRDPEQAEDLVQETWVAALRSPPRTTGSVAATRAFLGRVLRNAMLQSARSERHRRAREEAHARSELDAGEAELLEEVDSHRMLLEEVLALSEPARRTILLRYFRERSAAEIARAEGVPAATVRSRLKRALEELRGRLDARHGGDRSSWSLGVLAWAQPAPSNLVPAPAPHPPATPLGVAATLEGILLMNAVKIAVLAGAAVLTAYGVSRLARPSVEPAPIPTLAPIVPLERPVEDLAPAARLEPVRVAANAPDAGQRVAAARPTPAAAPVEASLPEAPALPLASTVQARFVERDGPAVPGVEFRFVRFTHRGEKPEVAVADVLSGGNGLALLELPLEQGRSFAQFCWFAEGYQPGSLEAELEAGGKTDLGTILLERGTPVSGRVVDLDGQPLRGAQVWAGPAELPEGDAGQIERRGPATVEDGFFGADSIATVTSGEDGTFRIPGVAAGGARVWGHHEGMRYCASKPFDVTPAAEVQGIEVVLTPLATDDRIEGLVLSRTGVPVPGAEVRFALRDEGFGLSSSIPSDDQGRFQLVVWRKTAHSFTVTGEEGSIAHAARVEPGTLDLVLRLGERESYTLSVSDPDGHPVESYQVTTCLGTERSWTGRVEQGEQHPGGRMQLGTPEDTFWLRVRAVGFVLGKLGPFEPEQVPQFLELVLEPAPTLSGRVYVAGAPRAGVGVELYRAVGPNSRVEVNGFPALWQDTGERAITDARGAFQLMPREAGEFLVRAELDDFAPAEAGPLRLAAYEGASDVDVHLGAGGTLDVRVLAAPGRDAAGTVVALTRADGHPRTLRVDTDGHAIFEHLTPGRWNVRTTDKELEPFMTWSSSHDAEEGDAQPEAPADVEVHEGRRTTFTLVLPEEGR